MLYLKGNFEKLYKLYYPKMFAFTKNYVPANEDAENIVQDVFLILWERKDEIEISFTLTTYLFTLVKNRCLNFLRHKLIEEEYNNQMKEELRFKLYALETFDYSYQSEEELQEISGVLLTHYLNVAAKSLSKAVSKGLNTRKYRTSSESL